MTPQRTDPQNKPLNDGDRVFRFDYDEDLVMRREYGTLRYDYIERDRWSITFDCGREYIIEYWNNVFKA